MPTSGLTPSDDAASGSPRPVPTRPASTGAGPHRPWPSDPETATDAELLARHVAGDPQAFAELFRRHRDRLWGVALRTLGNHEDAADALQDALLSAHRAAGRFRGDSAVTTWLHRIVVNACLDLARRRAVRPTERLDPEHTAAPGRDEIGERDTGLVVLAALRTLPVEQAAALVLVDIEGYSVAEASDILAVPQGTVKSRCARGRARLAGVLAPLGGDEPRPASVPSSSPVDEPPDGRDLPEPTREEPR